MKVVGTPSYQQNYILNVLSDANQWNYTTAIPRKFHILYKKKIGSSELNNLTVTHWSASSSQHSRSSPSSSIKQNIKKFSFFLNNHWMFYLFIWSFLIHQNDIHNLFYSKQKHANKKASYIFFLRIQTTDLLQMAVLSTRNINLLYRYE